MPFWNRRLARWHALHPFRDALDVQRVADRSAERFAVEKVVVARAFDPDRLALNHNARLRGQLLAVILRNRLVDMKRPRLIDRCADARHHQRFEEIRR